MRKPWQRTTAGHLCHHVSSVEQARYISVKDSTEGNLVVGGHRHKKKQGPFILYVPAHSRRQAGCPQGYGALDGPPCSEFQPGTVHGE